MQKHDPRYDTDYYQNTVTGRATWSEKDVAVAQDQDVALETDYSTRASPKIIRFGEATKDVERSPSPVVKVRMEEKQ